MLGSRFKALKCQISRGGFSDERVFILSGSIKHQGVGSRRHMWTSEGNPIEDGEPPLGKIIIGLVAARIIEIINQEALVSIPDGEVIKIPLSELTERPVSVGENVPVGS